MSDKPIILIDAFAQIYRGYYAIRYLTNSKQEPVNAIFAITKFLLRMHREYPSSCGAVVFDRGKPAFRMKLAPDYKANRPPMPDELRSQLDTIEEMIEAFGWPKFGDKDFEADDVIAAIASDIETAEFRIISADKDLAQLISPRVQMLVPGKKGAFELRGPEEVIEKFMVTPEQIVDYLSLIGDSSDNIPGVAGIGPKTAATLMAQAGSIKAMLEHPEKIEKEKLRLKVIESADLLRKNIKLVTLNTNIPDRPWLKEQAMIRREPDWDKIHELCETLELKSIVKEIETLRPAVVTDDLFAIPTASPQPTEKTATEPSQPEKFAPDLFG
jgi:5'-3' exonuclease